MLERPQPMTSARKAHNAQKYYEFKSKTGIQLPNAENIRRLLLDPCGKLHSEENSRLSRLSREPCYSTQMVFDGREGPHFATRYNDPLVVEMKAAGVIARRILIDIRNSVDIITWDCLRKLKYRGREIIPLVHPIMGFGWQEVNPIGMILLLLRFGDKVKVRNLEVDFLVVDVPTAYNVMSSLDDQLYKRFSSRLTIEVWASCKETRERPENDTLLASGCYCSNWLSVDLQGLHIKAADYASSSPG
ncbi:hypothetical protein Cgig2_026452 [Carnegiea gigantea]|uniref:Uncharacterized protein n=1 Tax=Carnegiea gigantea TaxID=171969 RepID=A0A9Q1QFX2_9CARY|nr:hypothetical protein Cgig2_026452 [Carnegiea gigantea]